MDWKPSLVNGSKAGPRPFTQSGVLLNSDYPFDTLNYAGGNVGQSSLGLGLFDTWVGAPANPTWNTGWASTPIVGNGSKLPLAVRVTQIQVTIRIFDRKTKQLGLRFIDLTPPLAAAAANEPATPENLLYYPTTIHYTARGHSVAAAALARFIEPGRQKING